MIISHVPIHLDQPLGPPDNEIIPIFHINNIASVEPPVVIFGILQVFFRAKQNTRAPHLELRTWSSPGRPSPSIIFLLSSATRRASYPGVSFPILPKFCLS